MEVALNALGGLALFLLAMTMMTDGLKIFGGQSLKRLLRDWTSSSLRAVMSGALITAIVQSSSAVTVATIGFVNGGMLSLRHALGVVFGANVGTTMTGWLVSLTGLGFRIEALALPILAAGVGVRMAAPGKRLQGLGEALAGFGLFFLGLAILKEAFSGVAESFNVGAFQGDFVAGGFGFFAVGFLATLLTQSSSAAIAIILTAASQSVIPVEGAAIAIIGANVGTTSTSVLAVLRATPNAKRVAAGHVAFNLLTALIALAILPAVLAFIAWIGNWAGLGERPAPLLALFHTVFNVLGVVLLTPFSRTLAGMLERLFRTEEEDLSRPRYLDKTVLATPSLAVDALKREVVRVLDLVCSLTLSMLRDGSPKIHLVRRRSEAMFALSQTVRDFAVSVRMQSLAREVAVELSRILRIERYLEEAARLAPETDTLRQEVALLRHEPTKAKLQTALDKSAQCVESFVQGEEGDNRQSERKARFLAFQEAYQESKESLLAAAAARTLDIESVDSILDALSHSRRMIEQLAKADRMLRSESVDNHQ